MNETEIRQRREDFALATYQHLLNTYPAKTWGGGGGGGGGAADALILELDKPQ